MTDDRSLDLTDVLAIDDEVTRSTGSAGFGVTTAGFLPKPFTRLLAERIASARQLIDPDLDLSSGSVVRKLLEISALEDARTWAALGSLYDDCFVTTARGRALGDLGAELGLSRPFQNATGTVTLTLAGALPAGVTQLVLPRGSRLGTAGGHRVALATTAILSPAVTALAASVVSFDPGPDGNLDPAAPGQLLDRWEIADGKLAALLAADEAAGLPDGASATGQGLVRIQHTEALGGGEQQWDDGRYRQLLLGASRSVWSAEAIATTVSLIPGVRQVTVRDGWGGIDLSQSVFGDFTFLERLFAADRDLASPYFVSVLVAPTEAAVWDGPNGLRAAVETAIRDVRPVGVFPDVVEADQVFLGIQAQVVTSGLALPAGSAASTDSSPAAIALKGRLLDRVHRIVDTLRMAEPVRTSAVTAALMGEPGVVDVVGLRLVRFPAAVDPVGSTTPDVELPQVLDQDQNLLLGADQIAVLVDATDRLTVR
ncbi:hypothetical protein HH310_28865 [Actinoplanes sp. TBRC 11911]|uniref:hypothetical protein n=1 Tax=Actinoplanes sp. TBRC 11911 TaxID=2729386 RepID=UPI00145FA1F5|nr:hypothetical protein [Actinoplanes sp. TBRC 11911]NMO55184.1 hypothetical protein [Actinoplanes sp. TBRC 11911]